MSKTSKNGDVVNNSNHLQRELDLINNEYQIIETERVLLYFTLIVFPFIFQSKYTTYT